MALLDHSISQPETAHQAKSRKKSQMCFTGLSLLKQSYSVFEVLLD